MLSAFWNNKSNNKNDNSKNTTLKHEPKSQQGSSVAAAEAAAATTGGETTTTTKNVTDFEVSKGMILFVGVIGYAAGIRTKSSILNLNMTKQLQQLEQVTKQLEQMTKKQQKEMSGAWIKLHTTGGTPWDQQGGLSSTTSDKEDKNIT